MSVILELSAIFGPLSVLFSQNGYGENSGLSGVIRYFWSPLNWSFTIVILRSKEHFFWDNYYCRIYVRRLVLESESLLAQTSDVDVAGP